MDFFSTFVQLVFRIGYFGPFVMGILDSSFLILPFGNDLLVVGMIAHNHQGAPWYVLSAACGSTAGAGLLALISAKLGEEGIRKVAGESRYSSLKKHIGSRSGFAVALAGLAPPPFPFTTVIAAVAALGYPIWKIMAVNFVARGTRFVILAFLAVRFGQRILLIAKSRPFEWTMVAFIALCVAASTFSVIHWLRHPRTQPTAPQAGD